MTGIEPAYSAWEADVLPLNYIGLLLTLITKANIPAVTLVACCSPIATSVPKSPPSGWASIRTTRPWCSRRASTSASTTCSVSSTTPATPTSTRRSGRTTSPASCEPDADEPFVLHPGEFVLGSTLELCTLPDDLAGRLEGKSSLGRLGLLTHSTAGFIDPGFTGHITLELSNVANLPITLWPGMKIGQLCLLRLTSPAELPYGSAQAGSKYQGQRGPTPSRSYQNFIKSS